MTRNLIFFDVDGTIITGDNYIPSSAVEAIHAAQRAGNLCIVNTGRPFSHIVPSVRDIGFSGYICSCGQHVILEDQVIYHDGFSPREAREIVAILRETRMEAVFESEQGVAFLSEGQPGPLMEAGLCHLEELGFRVSRNVDAESFCFDKFCVVSRANCNRERFLQCIEPYCEIILREQGLIELVKKGHSKETGIHMLMDRLQVTPEHCYALGDSTNDIPMFRCVHVSIAMGDATEEVQALSTYVTAPLREDGVAKALAFYGLTE